QPDAVSLGSVPLAVIPRARDHEVRVIGVVLRGVTEDLPRSPWVFLIPESRDVQVGDRRSVQLADPRFLLPESVVIRMGDDLGPERDRPVQVAGVDVREWA